MGHGSIQAKALDKQKNILGIVKSLTKQYTNLTGNNQACDERNSSQARLKLVSSIALCRHTLWNKSLLLLVLSLELLLLEGGGLGELEHDGVGGELLVGTGEGFKAVSHNFLIEGVKEDNLGALTVLGNTDLATGNVRGGNDVVKGLHVDSLKGTGAGSLLGGVGDSCKI